MPSEHPLAHILRAIAEGKEIQWQSKGTTHPNVWYDLVKHKEGITLWNDNKYRVKPEQKKFRVCLFQTLDGVPYAVTAQHEAQGNNLEQCGGFVRWLTDWTFYDI